MARRLTNEENEIRMIDPVNNEERVFFYRLPNTGERFKYTNEMLKRQGAKIKISAGEIRLKFGLKILTNIRDEDFERKNKAGEWVPISSRPGSEFYREDWKNLIEEHASDLVSLMAMQIFEGAEVVRDDILKN